ncbi:MAG: NADH-quinone oxidoreductase subunit NuoE [Burkholderiaceae bacterium]|nr:MAG: NADH-quinone oxidoreductase subunit NuoE [Burkholderiaceae bacterium]TAM01967.1 MAG: NADH-quinone oxidoreductase subunit NuoE [Pusillimonas sp.]
MLLSEQAYRKIDKELTKFPANRRRSATLAALTIAQDEKGWVSTEVIEEVANYLRLAPIAVQEVASFYNMLNTKPVGRYKITVCSNLPCALQGSVVTIDHLKRKLGVDLSETTEDGMFTLQEGECMGACGDAPVMLVNDKHMCVRMVPEEADVLLDALKKDGGAL